MIAKAQLLQRLIELAIAEGQSGAIVQQALTDVIEACRAQVAYVELRDLDGTVAFVRGAGRDSASLEIVRGKTSDTIAARVIATGAVERTVAMNDLRFNDLDSVRQNKIAAVVCAPVQLTIATPPIGVVYVQRSDDPAPFDDDEVQLVEWFAKVVAKSAVPELASTRPLDVDVERAEVSLIRSRRQVSYAAI